MSILRLPAVIEDTGLSRPTIYRWISQGQFPAPIKLGTKAVGWTRESIDSWLAARIAASQGGNAISPGCEK